jgi:HSP20 family protein
MEVTIMMIVRRPSPFGELLSLRQAMDRLFEDRVVRPVGWGAASFDPGVPVDVSVTADALVVEAQLPGIKPDDVDITVENGTLTIRADSSEETHNRQGDDLVQEIRRGTISRTLRLPNGLEPDKAKATFEDGVLTLRIPKADEVKPRQIRISQTGNGSPASQRSISSTAATADQKAS